MKKKSLFFSLYLDWCLTPGITTLENLIKYLKGLIRYSSYTTWHDEWILKENIFITDMGSMIQYTVMEDIIKILQMEIWILISVYREQDVSEDISEISSFILDMEKTLIESDLKDRENLSNVLSNIKSSIQSLQ